MVTRFAERPSTVLRRASSSSPRSRALPTKGARYARLESLGRGGTLIAITLNLALGLVVVVLKVAIAH